MKLGKKEPFSHWDWGQYLAPKTQSENHLYYFNQILIVILFVLFLLLIVIILLFLVHLVQAIKWAIVISYCCQIFSIFIVHEHFLCIDLFVQMLTNSAVLVFYQTSSLCDGIGADPIFNMATIANNKFWLD